MEQYRTEEEQVEALRRWWDENGRSTIIAIVVALSAGFGWQGWKSYDKQNAENASNVYQAMLQSLNVEEMTQAQRAITSELALQLKSDYAGSSYAQFAALHLASMAVDENNLGEAEAQLRWVLSHADKGGDIAQVTELRLARVLAAGGKLDQALDILQQAGTGQYAASAAVARGDVLLQMGRADEARDAYTDARALASQTGAQVNLATLEQKLQSLTPIPARELDVSPADATSNESEEVTPVVTDMEPDASGEDS